MKQQSRNQALVWGGLLIIFGVVGLVESFTDLTPWAWVAILAITGLGIFGVFLWDRSEWWPLIPTYVLWSIAHRYTIYRGVPAGSRAVVGVDTRLRLARRRRHALAE